MSAHVLFNLMNELGKRDKLRGLPSVLSLFPTSSRARLLDTLKSHFLRKR